MTALTEIFNAAFTALGEEGVTDALTDTSHKATIARARWPFTLDAVLRSHPWNCASELAVLAPLSTAPAWKYSFQYTLPTDPWCLRILEVDQLDSCDWQVFGRKIFTNQGTSISIRYVKRITDYNEVDGALMDSLVDALASELAFAQIGSPEIAKLRQETFNAKNSWARTIDGQEGKPRRITSRALVNVRLPGGSSVAGPKEWMNG